MRLFFYVLVLVFVSFSLLMLYIASYISAELSVLLFAVFSFLFAMVYPLVFEPLNNDSVDFWYYSFAIAGVVLFFWSETSKRNSISLELSINSLETAIDLAERDMGALKKNPDNFFHDLKENAKATLRTGSLASCDSSSLNELMALGAQNELSVQGFFQEREGLCDIEAMHRFFFIKLSTVQNIDDLKKVLKLIDYMPPIIWHQYIGPERIMAWQSLSDEKHYTELQRIQEKLRQKWAERTEPGGDSTGTELKVFRHAIWPFLLISALALKLARKRYLRIFRST